MNLKQLSFLSSNILRGILIYVIYIGVLVVIMYLGHYFFNFLSEFGIPFTQYFAENPKMIILFVLGSLAVHFIMKDIRSENHYFTTLINTISEVKQLQLSEVGERNGILSKLEIISSFKEYKLNNSHDIIIRFYGTNVIDIEIKDFKGNYFKVKQKDPSAVNYNLLNVSDSESDQNLLKKVFKTRPKVLESKQVQIILEIVELLNLLPSIKCNDSGLMISLNKEFDPNNSKQISNFLNDLREIPSILSKHKL